MNTDYIYEDNKYAAAVNNLKATFFDIVYREEAMLNNLEARIANENREDVRDALLDLWSKQNNGLDSTLRLLTELTDSIKILDSFTKDLSNIDEKIVQEIVNSTNVKDDEVTDDKNFVSEMEDNPQEIVEKEAEPEKPIEKNVVAEEPKEEVVPEPEEKEVIEPAPEVEQPEPEQPPVEEETTDEMSSNTDSIEFDSNTGFGIDFNENNENFEPITESNQEYTEAPLLNAFDENTDVPEMEVVNEANDGMDLPYSIEPTSIEMPQEDDAVEESPALSSEEVPVPTVVSTDGDIFNQNVYSEEGPTSEETPEIIMSQEVSADEIPEAVPTEEVPQDTYTEEGPVIDVPQDNVISEENYVNEEEDKAPIIPTINEEVPSTEEEEEKEPLIPTVNEEATIEENEMAEDELIDKVRVKKILKSTQGSVKAIIVNKDQYSKLASSFDDQKDLLYKYGYLTDELVTTSNSILGTLSNNDEEEKEIETEVEEKPKEKETKPEEAVDNIVNNQVTAEDIEVMLEQANNLYKQGKADEAQALYDEISSLNKTLNQNKELKVA